jgi:hypothetical protein
VLDTSQAAALLKLSERQVREHAEAGRLRGTKINPRMWIFRRGDVEAFTPAPRGRPKVGEAVAPPKTARKPRKKKQT